MKIKRIVSVVVSVAMLFALAIVPVSAKENKANSKEVTLIVEMEGPSLLQTKEAANLGVTDFFNTEEAKASEVRLLSAQEDVKEDINRNIKADTDDGFIYTGAFNGFSMKAHESDIEKIKALDGVKNVYISNSYDIEPVSPISLCSVEQPEPGVGASMMNSQYMYAQGYNGKGQAVAIIDSEFDVGHEFFSSSIDEPKFSKDDIRNFISNTELNVSISANQVYKNEKIPFAYDYAENDADTFSTVAVHGTHVAGIVAGKNGDYYGNYFSGVAPEAQLILMKCGDDDGHLADETLLAAFDDASKMDVCAINLSAGSQIVDAPLYKDVFKTIRESGKLIICAAGNDNRAIETTNHPDYAFPSHPAIYNESTSIASINANEIWVTTQKMKLGNEDIVTYNEEDGIGFFEKFSDKFYDYVLIDEGQGINGDISNKILICDTNTLLGLGSIKDYNLAAIIILFDQDYKGTLLPGDIPLIFINNSAKEQFAASSVKTLQTINNKEHNKVENKPIMSDFTNWGTTTNLNLKPEITAPGGTIMSSVINDEYENKSGTSMAAPHMTGAIALLNGYMEDKYPLIKGAEKASLMENLLMSSADIIFQDEEKTLPESPRRQGAGLADLKAAINLPVILKGDEGKSKLSLGDMLANDIELTFTAENLTNQVVEYDDVKLFVFTDNYETIGGVNYITNSVPLKFTSSVENEKYTIPANDSKEITVTFELDENQVRDNLKIFENGFFVDGFVVLNSSNNKVQKANIPFTGFYGDWTAFEALEPSYFEPNGGLGGLVVNDVNNGDKYILGQNQILLDLISSGKVSDSDYEISDYESEEYVGYSPNFDGMFDTMCLELYPFRDLINTGVTIYDSENNVIDSIENPNGVGRHGSDPTPIDITSILLEGDYTITFRGNLDFESERNVSIEKSYKFYVDTTPPQISVPKIYEENGRKYASFTASDNRYLMGAQAFEGDNEIAAIPIKASNQADVVLDITDAENVDNLKFVVTDYAYNQNEFKIGDISMELVGVPVTSGNALSFIVSISNTTEDVEADVISAIYSEDNKLIDVKVQQGSLISGQNVLKSFDFQNAKDYRYAKVFLWRQREMIPLTEALVFNN